MAELLYGCMALKHSNNIAINNTTIQQFLENNFEI